MLQTSSTTIARQLLLERSTNLHQLAHDPVRVLFASAFWVSGAWELLAWLALFTLVVAPVEHWIGTARTAAVFFAGHLGATLAHRRRTLGGHPHRPRRLVPDQRRGRRRELRLPRRRRSAHLPAPHQNGDRSTQALLTAIVAGALALDPSITNVGHLLALAIGFACYPLVRPFVTEGSARRIQARTR